MKGYYKKILIASLPRSYNPTEKSQLFENVHYLWKSHNSIEKSKHFRKVTAHQCKNVYAFYKYRKNKYNINYITYILNLVF